MKRFQLHVSVQDLAESVRYYVAQRTEFPDACCAPKVSGDLCCVA